MEAVCARFPRVLTSKPWQAPLLGLAVIVAAPVAAILLLITVVGVQPALLMLLLYPVALYSGQVLLSWTVGRLVADRWMWLDRPPGRAALCAGGTGRGGCSLTAVESQRRKYRPRTGCP